MLKLFLVMALMFLPLSVPYGSLLIGLALLAVGMAYGLLRYCGVLVFPNDDPLFHSPVQLQRRR